MTGDQTMRRDIRKGLWAHFLCDSCERRFQTIDQHAAQVFVTLSLRDRNLTVTDSGVGVECHKPTNADLETIHLFAASVLWRAAHCGLHCYAAIALGKKYEEEIRKSICDGAMTVDLKAAIGIFATRYEGGDAIRNQSFFAVCKYRFTERNYGAFTAWELGFPYGSVLIRLGRARAKLGFFAIGDAKPPAVLASLWSCNVSDAYPYWAWRIGPRTELDDHFVLGRMATCVLKNRPTPRREH